MATQFQSFLEKMDFLDQFQSGFRSGFVTETALVAFVGDLRRVINILHVSLLTLLNLSAASDTIGHGICLGHLSRIGVSDIIL